MLPLLRARLLTALLAFGFVAVSANAQELSGYGVKAVAVSSTTTDDLAGQSESIWGAGVGAFAEWRVAGPLSVIPQLEYAPRGVRQQFVRGVEGDGFQTADAEMRLHYVSLPLFAKAGYRFDGTPFTIYAMLGPRLDIMVGRESGAFQFEDETVPSSLAERYDQAAVGISGGVGLQIDLSKGIALTLEARQHRDVTASVEEGGTQFVDTTTGDLRNLATDFSVGLKWQ